VNEPNKTERAIWKDRPKLAKGRCGQCQSIGSPTWLADFLARSPQFRFQLASFFSCRVVSISNLESCILNLETRISHLETRAKQKWQLTDRQIENAGSVRFSLVGPWALFCFFFHLALLAWPTAATAATTTNYRLKLCRGLVAELPVFRGGNVTRKNT